MSALAMIDTELVAGPLRLGGVSNETKLEMEAAALDATVFTSGGWRAYAAGLKKATVESSGFMDSAPFETGGLAADAELWTQLGAGQIPVTLAATAADLSVAYIVPTRRGNVQLFGKVGDVAPFASSMWGDGQVARGQLIHPANVVRTTGGTGSTAVLGTIATGRNHGSLPSAGGSSTARHACSAEVGARPAGSDAQPPATRPASSTTTSSAPSSKACARPIPTRRSTGWRKCSMLEKTFVSSPGASSSPPVRTSAWQTAMHCVWPWRRSRR